jgi:hypothetical protein
MALLASFYFRTRYLRVSPWLSLLSLIGPVNVVAAIYLAWMKPASEKLLSRQ